jgi:two-component system, sensor histidine kinase
MKIPREDPPRASLRRRIFLLVMASTLGALLISASALLVYEFQSSKVASIEDVRSQADLIEQSVLPALVFDDRKSVQQALQALQLRAQIEMAVVYGADGNVVGSYQSAESARRGHVLPASAQPDGPRYTSSATELTQGLRHEGERLGAIYIRLGHDLLGRILDYLLILALAGSAAACVAALIFRRLHPKITGPILEMAEVSRRIMDDRNYSLRVTSRSDDELGVLVAAFNNMLEALARQMKEREQAEAALLHADQMKDRFLATLAHELRNPLAPMTTAVELLKRGDHDPPLRARMRDLMARQLRQMVRLIDDLLEVSRITRGKLDLRREPVLAAEVARQALEACEGTFAKKRQTLEARWSSEPLWIHADAARMTQVLVNLLNNASRYTQEEGEITFALEACAGAAAFVVSDNGLGIAPEHQQAVFDMFVQVDSSLERGAAGLGIGLTIARELVRLHDGTLTLSSEGIGKGTTFTASLPTMPAPIGGALQSSNEQVPERTLPIRIVLADDNVDFADSFAEILRQSGHQVTVAYDGVGALRAIDAERPQAAFLDIGMPGLNGLLVAQRIRASAGMSVLLVAVTGWGQQADRERVKEAGFDHHLVKPVNFLDALALLASRYRVRGDVREP